MTWFVTSEGVRLRVCDRGAGESTVVLVHGWKGSHRLWDLVVAGLEKRHRVVAFDLRGMGESDKPRCAYSFDELASDLREIIVGLDLRNVTLVGWSMGCSVAMAYLDAFATADTDVDGDRLAGLVLHNGPVRLTQTPDFPHAMPQAQFDAYLQQLEESWPVGEHAFLAESVLDTTSPLVVDWMWQIALQTPLDVVLRVVREQTKLDMRDVLPHLRVPVLAAYSTRDPYYPFSLAEEIAELAPRGEVAKFEHSAHCTPIEEAPAFIAAVEAFITRHSGR